ncbi:MAG: anthranilate synthase component I [Thermomicrobiales bacterium]|nr:anthranilate synthase component I [Thermomicrobiales bacterium]
MVTAVSPKPAVAQRGSFSPSLDELEHWLASEQTPPRLVPVFREVMADTETPVSALVKLRDESPCFVLESIEGGERVARYSFVGSHPVATLTFQHGFAELTRDGKTTSTAYDDPLDVLRDLLAEYQSSRLPGMPLPRFLGGAVGYLSFESVNAFEPRVGEASGPGRGLPDGSFMIVDGLLVFDNLERTIKVVSHVDTRSGGSLRSAYEAATARIDATIRKLRASLPELPHGAPEPPRPLDDRLQLNTPRSHYDFMIEKAKNYILEGDIFQVVLSHRVDVPTPVHPFTIYRALRAVNPSPYMFYLDFVDHHIVGASPELLVRLEDGVVTNHPIAGTRPRGQTPEHDAALAIELLADEKERAEHVMLVDLGRNDIGRVSTPGTVRVPRFMEIDRYSHVMHIVTHVEGDLKPELDCFDALRACFPAGTVSGAPKVRAMEIITELEIDRRGPYSGAVGYMDFAGGMDTCIALRTLVHRDGVASLQAGGGVVADSTVDGEYAETFHKMRALMRAIEFAERIEYEEFGPDSVEAQS